MTAHAIQTGAAGTGIAGHSDVVARATTIYTGWESEGFCEDGADCNRIAVGSRSRDGPEGGGAGRPDQRRSRQPEHLTAGRTLIFCVLAILDLRVRLESFKSVLLLGDDRL